MLAESMIWSLGGWVIRLGMIPVIGMRQENPSTCLAWLAVIFLMPWPGLILYLLLEEHGLSRPRLSRRIKKHKNFHLNNSSYLTTPNFEGCQVNPDHQTLVHLAEKHGGLPLLGSNRMKLIADTQEFIDSLTADILKARNHVHLLFYIFRNDFTGQRVAQALAEAAGRGVTCRVLADAVGSAGMFSGLGRWMQDQGVQVQNALPANPLRMRLARLDIRNHRKLAVIDGQVGYTGSQNIVDPEFGHKKAGQWHDVMTRVQGPTVRQLQSVFVADWFYETQEMLEAPDIYPPSTSEGMAAVQVVPTGPDRPTYGFQDLLIQAINSAQRSVSVVSPYFIPNEGLITALRLASARGVEVDIIVPDRSDHLLVDQASAYYCGVVLNNGGNVHLFRDGMLHAKIIAMDHSLAIVGSANFDIRSFYLNMELVSIVFDQQFSYELSLLVEGYKKNSFKVGRAWWSRRPVYKRMTEGVVKIFSPLL